MWMTLCSGSARAEDFGNFEKVSWVESCLGRRRLAFACSPKPCQRPLWWVPHEMGRRGGGRWKSQNRKNVHLSPYVEEPLNSKVIKSFVPELRSRVFRVSRFLCLFILYMSISHIRIMGMVHSPKTKYPPKTPSKQPTPKVRSFSPGREKFEKLLDFKKRLDRERKLSSQSEPSRYNSSSPKQPRTPANEPPAAAAISSSAVSSPTTTLKKRQRSSSIVSSGDEIPNQEKKEKPRHHTGSNICRVDEGGSGSSS